MVGKLEYIRSNQFVVGGRNSRDELRKGDRLQVIGGCCNDSIEVTVDEITMYDRTVAVVPHGLTAGLVLSNEVAQYFRLGTELHAEII